MALGAMLRGNKVTSQFQYGLRIYFCRRSGTGERKRDAVRGQLGRERQELQGLADVSDLSVEEYLYLSSRLRFE